MKRNDVSALAAAQLVALDEARLEGIERRPLDPVEGRVQGGDGEEHPQLRVGHEAVREQDAAGSHHPELAEENHSPTVDRVGERSTEEREPEDRDELGQPDQADHERGAAELVGLKGDRDERDHRAEKRDRLADEEQPKLPAPPQRPDVEHGNPEAAPDPAGPLAGEDRRRGGEPLAFVKARVRAVAVLVGHGAAP